MKRDLLCWEGAGIGNCQLLCSNIFSFQGSGGGFSLPERGTAGVGLGVPCALFVHHQCRSSRLSLRGALSVMGEFLMCR